MQPLSRLIPLAIAAALLAACSSPTATAPASAEESASPGTGATDTPPAATAEPIPSEDLADFTCDLPFVEQATVPRTVNIVDVRVGSHEGYDRVVFEFNDGTPEIALERATPPFVQDGSGEPMDVEGESFLRLIMRGGTKQMEDGTSSYGGSRDFDPGFPALVDLVEGGDFEAQSTWYLGLSAESCVRVSLLEDEPRLVIDIEH
ncbi:MAG: hypothetical protein ABI841_03500 [Chloroflexota bacterium]